MVVTDSDTGEEFAIYWQDSRNQSRLFFFFLKIIIIIKCQGYKLLFISRISSPVTYLKTWPFYLCNHFCLPFKFCLPCKYYCTLLPISNLKRILKKCFFYSNDLTSRMCVCSILFQMNRQGLFYSGI